jgi:hypothetical protein
MSVASSSVKRALAAGLMMFMVAPLVQAYGEVPLQALTNQQKQDVSSLPVEPEAAATRDPQNAPPVAPQQAQEPVQSGSGKPVGTAAAPEEKTSGVTASRPAGAVIAPAKQKRARAILIRVGIVVAAAAAVGCVVGLSKGSSARP